MYAGCALAPITDIDGQHNTVVTVVDEAALERFPQFLHSSAGSSCSVCLAEYAPTDLLRLLPDCGHVFHAYWRKTILHPRIKIDAALKLKPSLSPPSRLKVPYMQEEKSSPPPTTEVVDASIQVLVSILNRFPSQCKFKVVNGDETG
ncbi:43kDa postsynaptic protein [Trema orientale]|uniref:43kDa postsynaptic protein n=1 Tax=Trema orientale TaxID=63057 RepID=A0A2P5FA06_TREOI|nr:43kDa postsynaptic protein [Trema orientale]